MSFSTLGLTETVLRGVDATGYTDPTPIQALAIPPALEGRDVIGRAQTGTGKTAAFALPILCHIERVARPRSESHGSEGDTPPAKPSPAPRGRRRRQSSPSGSAVPKPIRALVLTPTRELALQIEEAFREYARFMDVSTLTVYGGVRIDKQISKLQSGVDVVIATPGRLMDHMRRRTIDLSQVEALVLDEVDRMFDMGFIDDVRIIVADLPRKRQTLLFSATISSQVRRLAERIQNDPVIVEVGESHNPVETVTQHVYPTQRDRKIELLRRIVVEEKMDMVLVFCGTRDAADFVARRLQHVGIDAAELHSNLAQRERQSALDGFKNGEHRVLVATDIAARGLDIEGISHVVNYDVPRYAEDYIHRIGRTGRAAATGDAITLVAYEEEEFFSRIEDFIERKFERKRYKDFDHGVVKLVDSPYKGSRFGAKRRGKRKYV